MTSQVIDSLIEELYAKLGDRAFISIRQLVDWGIYGSMSAARMALADGHLPFIRISARRFAVPRVALIAYLKENFDKKNKQWTK